VAQASAILDTRLCRAIQRHLMTHPFAADTAAGILAAWLPPRGFEDAADHLAAALEALVAQQWLRVHTLPDGNVLYVANPDKCSISPPTS
jgi:arginine utilization protein RocB